MDYKRTHFERILDAGEIISLHYFPYAKNFSFPGETHDFWELILVESGEVTVFDEHSSAVRAGEGFLHAPNHYHNIKSKNFSNIFIFTFDCEEPGLFDCASHPFAVTPVMRSLSHMIMVEMESCLDGPLDLLYQDELRFQKQIPFGTKQMIRSALEMILLEILRKKPAEPLPRTANRILADDIAAILRANLSRKISIEEISRLVGYCPTHVKRVFRAEYGDSLIHYLLELRVTEAKKLLSSREYTVTQAAETLGFENVQYFSAFFRRYTNMTPTQYISANQGLV